MMGNVYLFLFKNKTFTITSIYLILPIVSDMFN